MALILQLRFCMKIKLLAKHLCLSFVQLICAFGLLSSAAAQLVDDKDIRVKEPRPECVSALSPHKDEFAVATETLRKAGLDPQSISLDLYPYHNRENQKKYIILIGYNQTRLGWAMANIEYTRLSLDSLKAIQDRQFQQQGLGTWLYLLLGRFFYSRDHAILTSSGTYFEFEGNSNVRPGRLLWQKLKSIGVTEGEAFSLREEQQSHASRLHLSTRFLDTNSRQDFTRWIHIHPPTDLRDISI